MSENINAARYTEIAVALAELYVRENPEKLKNLQVAKALGISVPELVEFVREARERDAKQIAQKRGAAPVEKLRGLGPVNWRSLPSHLATEEDSG